MNEFMPLSDQQIVVTTCQNAADEKEKLLEFYKYSKVIGLPNEYECAQLDSDEWSDYRRNLQEENDIGD